MIAHRKQGKDMSIQLFEKHKKSQVPFQKMTLLQRELPSNKNKRKLPYFKKNSIIQ